MSISRFSFKFKNSFSNGFGKKPRTFWIPTEIDTTLKLENYIQKDSERFYVVIDSIHTTRYKNDLVDMFNKIQDFIILRNLSETKDLSTRKFYSGKLRFDTQTEFFARLKTMLVQKITDAGESWDQFIKSL